MNDINNKVLFTIPEHLRLPLVIAIMVTFVSCLVFSAYSPFKTWQAYRNLKRLSKSFRGSKLSYCFVEAKMTGMYEGMTFVIRHYIGNNGWLFSPSYNPGISVSLKFNNTARMRIVIYKFSEMISSFGKTSVFLKEVENLPAEIEKFTLYSNMPFEARRFFSDEKRIEALQYFWKNYWIKGMESMSIGKRCVFARRSVSAADLTPDFIREILDNMIALRMTDTGQT